MGSILLGRSSSRFLNFLNLQNVCNLLWFNSQSPIVESFSSLDVRDRKNASPTKHFSPSNWNRIIQLRLLVSRKSKCYIIGSHVRYFYRFWSGKVIFKAEHFITNTFYRKNFDYAQLLVKLLFACDTAVIVDFSAFWFWSASNFQFALSPNEMLG